MTDKPDDHPDPSTRGDGVLNDWQDQGPGVSESETAEVFRRGWRGARSRDSRPSGSGLGLTIVRQVAESHGGTASVARAEGGGAVFTIDLPTGVGQVAVGPGVQTV